MIRLAPGSPSTPRPAARRGFSLIELLVTVAIIAVVLAIALPSLSAAREAGRSAACQSNHRQLVIACRAYADDFKGLGPAIGQPYTEFPNWAFVVQQAAGREASASNPDPNSQVYTNRSILVCPAIDATYPEAMVRTYAMNATGHAGLPGVGSSPPDASNFDDPARPAHIRFDLVQRPSQTPLFVDSAIAPINGIAPPSTRTASVIDFRQPAHVRDRLGRFHKGQRAGAFNAAAFDASVRAFTQPLPEWSQPLP